MYRTAVGAESLQSFISHLGNIVFENSLALVEKVELSATA